METSTAKPKGEKEGGNASVLIFLKLNTLKRQYPREGEEVPYSHISNVKIKTHV